MMVGNRKQERIVCIILLHTTLLYHLCNPHFQRVRVRVCVCVSNCIQRFAT